MQKIMIKYYCGVIDKHNNSIHYQCRQNLFDYWTVVITMLVK